MIKTKITSKEKATGKQLNIDDIPVIALNTTDGERSSELCICIYTYDFLEHILKLQLTCSKCCKNNYKYYNIKIDNPQEYVEHLMQHDGWYISGSPDNFQILCGDCV